MREYMTFYIQGRDNPKGVDEDFDIDELAQRVIKGGEIRDVIMKAVTDAAKTLEHARTKREWLADNENFIQQAGGNADEAYKHYVQGLIDETCYLLEPDVVEAINVEVHDLDEDDCDDEEEDDEDDNNEDEEEED